VAPQIRDTDIEVFRECFDIALEDFAGTREAMQLATV
jgi:hypothetical protein